MNTVATLNLLQTAVLLFVLLRTIRLIGTGMRPVRLVFFGFAVASVFLSNLYWLTYDILRPDARMPFAANEIGEWAMFLLLGAALNAREQPHNAKWQMLGAVLFAAANAALWIAWSGAWVQDILTGAAFGWFLCCLVARMRQEGALSPWQWGLLGAVCVLLIAAQTVIFFVPEPAGQALDLFCYILLFAGAAAFLARAILSLLHAEGTVCHCFAAHGWIVTALYMSTGGFYVAALLLSTACFVLMLAALKKEADAV